MSIEEYLKNKVSFVVKYSESGEPIVEKYKGIRKISDKEVKKAIRTVRGGRRIPRKILEVLPEIVNKLVENKVPFKVLFGRNEITLSFSRTSFIRLYRDKVYVAGFKNLEEIPLSYIADIIKKVGKIYMLKPL